MQANKSRNDKKRKLLELENKKIANAVEKELRRPMKKLNDLENTLKDQMASPLATMLPPMTQNEIAGILQDVQRTHKDGRQVVDSRGTVKPSSFASVDQLLHQGSHMSLWLKRMIGSYDLRWA